MVPPAFITLEGLDGSGKSTQAGLLAAWLQQQGQAVVLTREPGGTPLGERIRALVLADHPGAAAETELALMGASRAQSVRELIRPALARGAWVVCDRFHDATEAYQGGGRGLDKEAIRGLHQALCGGLQPDLTLVLDLDPAASLARARRLASASRFEGEGDAFFQRVAEVYRDIARREPQRCLLLPAAGTPEDVAARVRTAVQQRLGWRP